MHLEQNRTWPESLPLYRHYWLYPHFEQYQRAKYLTDEGLKTCCNIREKELSAEKELGLADIREELPAWNNWRYSDRYAVLASHTAFFKKFVKLAKIFIDAVSYSEYKLQDIALGHTEGQARYAMMYAWINPKRIFKFYPYGNWTMRRQVGKNHTAIYADMEFIKWQNFRNMLRDCMKDIGVTCDYEQFIEGEEDDPS